MALEGYTLSANEANIAVGETVTVKFNREPEDANLYDIIWTSSDENVAVVDGNKRKVKITGSGSGTATVTGTVMVNGSVYGTAVIAVSVTGDESLAAALNVEGGNLWFGTSTEYPFTAVDDGTRVFARSGNKRVVNSKSQLMLTIAMQSGDTMAFDYICSSQTDRDFFNFYVNRQVELRKSGVTEPIGSVTHSPLPRMACTTLFGNTRRTPAEARVRTVSALIMLLSPARLPPPPSPLPNLLLRSMTAISTATETPTPRTLFSQCVTHSVSLN